MKLKLYKSLQVLERTPAISNELLQGLTDVQ